jgi:hypothetical protein
MKDKENSTRLHSVICFAMMARLAGIPELFLGNSSANIFPQQQT